MIISEDELIDFISTYVVFFLLASIPEDVNPAGVPAFFLLEGIVPRTRTENIVFALLMVFFMVVAMEFYNQGLMDGRLSWAAMERSIHEMKFMIPICFVMSFFIADPIASRITMRNMEENSDRVLRIVFRAAVTVSMMCPIMSFWATLIFQKPDFVDFIPAWLTTVAKNLPMAFFWQILFCGPLVRFLFRCIFRKA